MTRFRSLLFTQAGPQGAGLGLFILCCVLVGCSRPSAPPITLIADQASGPISIRLADDKSAFEVGGISGWDREGLSKTFGVGEALFAVYADKQTASEIQGQPSIVGSYSWAGPTLRFEQRFPLVPGVRYLAVFDRSKLPYHAPGDEGLVTASFVIPKSATPPTVVEQVYPTRNLLPENQLKFYIHFSAPMSRGEAYEHIKLLDAAGKPIEAAFLELGEELWDPAGKRFTLLFDPGRIKHGLKPREDLGPVLESGKSYTLVVEKGWNDANGNPIQQTFRKPFKVGSPVDKPVDPMTWKIEAPAAGNDPLTVTFPKPHDHALLLREVWVTDADGKRLAGAVKVSEGETRWQFTPESAWKPGAYKLVAKTTLEDLAGNKIGRLFEVDEFGPIQKEVKAETAEVGFVVRDSSAVK